MPRPLPIRQLGEGQSGRQLKFPSVPKFISLDSASQLSWIDVRGR